MLEKAQSEDHVTFEIKSGDHMFQFVVPKKASIGNAYDAAFEMLRHIIKSAEEVAKKMVEDHMKAQEEIAAPNEEKKEEVVDGKNEGE